MNAQKKDGRSGQGLPKRHRIRKDKEFRRVLDHGKRFAGSAVLVFAIPNQRGCSRLGLIVSRRHGNAVRRNRIKRQFREIFRIRKTEIRGNFDIVLIPRLSSREKQYKDFEQDFMRWTAVESLD